MNQEMEFEAKNLLTEEEYQRLYDHLNHNKIKPKTQINYYFETEAFSLKHNASALRIRETEDQLVVTLKQPKNDGILETHQKITQETKDKWLNNQITNLNKIGDQLKKLNINHSTLKYWGELKTIRFETQLDDVLIVLDKSMYHNQVDYELEVEAGTRQHADQVLNCLLDKYQITKKKTPNKIERFFTTR